MHVECTLDQRAQLRALGARSATDVSKVRPPALEDRVSGRIGGLLSQSGSWASSALPHNGTRSELGTRFTLTSERPARRGWCRHRLTGCAGNRRSWGGTITFTISSLMGRKLRGVTSLVPPFGPGSQSVEARTATHPPVSSCLAGHDFQQPGRRVRVVAVARTGWVRWRCAVASSKPPGKPGQLGREHQPPTRRRRVAPPAAFPALDRVMCGRS